MTYEEYMSNMAQIGIDLRALIKQYIGTPSMFANVEGVDEENNTMTARIGSDDLVISDISLTVYQSGDSSVIFYPEVGSLVVLASPYGQSTCAFVQQFTLLDKITIKIGKYNCEFSKERISLSCGDGASVELQGKNVTLNGGSLGGLVVVDKLVSTLNTMVGIFNAHTHPDKNKPTTTPMTATNANNLQNNKVTQ